MSFPPTSANNAACWKGRKTHESLTCRSAEGTNLCGFYVRKDADFRDEGLWPEIFDWLREKQETMHKVLAPVVKKLGF